jgi:hypothetical protein
LRSISTSIGAELPVGTDQALFGHLGGYLVNLDFVWFSAELDCTQCFADLAKIDAPRTLALTRETRSTAPRGVNIENLLKAKLQIANDLVRQ